MLFSEDFWQFLCLEGIVPKTRASAASILQTVTSSMTNRICQSGELDLCRDERAARVLKFVGIASILLAGVAGVAIPLVGRHRQFLRTDGSLFMAAKAFAAGVILATGFVHMLSGGSDALTDPCLPEFPWAKFPFSGFFAMLAALATLLVDVVGTQYYARKQRRSAEQGARVGSYEADPKESCGVHIGGDQNCALEGGVRGDSHGHGHGHGHSFGFGDGDENGGVRHVVVSQVLELGIVSHSIIIGLSLGVSQSPCTIRPLIAALSFHQFFEGFALGGCISQAQFKTRSASIMACFFAITTPAGIGIGTAIASFYNPYSTGALVTEGILDSLSAGILVYMALVDLVAADFLSKRMSSNFRLQLVSYLMLFLGAGLMSSLAIWA